MSFHPRRILTPGASRKRKEREAFYSSKPSSPVTTVNHVNATTSSKGGGATAEPLGSNNRLLAGYMAYEFLTKGTLFGQKFDPARAEAMPVNSFDSKRTRNVSQSHSSEAEPSGKVKPPPPQGQTYHDVASLLKTDGVHIQGIVNPTQLARWIQM